MNIGTKTMAFNKELNIAQKLFVDKIREYKSKQLASGGPFHIGPGYKQELERELSEHKQMANGTRIKPWLRQCLDGAKL
jgi:hypothetical protein